MDNVIHIKLHEALSTNNQNKLRYKIELGIWRQKWREAEATKDYYQMDRLQIEYEMVGLP